MDKKEYQKEYYKKNKERLNAYRRKWWNENKERNSKKRKKQYDEDKEKYLKQKKRDYEKHKIKRLKSAKEYRNKNKPKSREYQKEYRKVNKKKLKDCGRKYFQSKDGRKIHQKNKIKRRTIEKGCLFKLSKKGIEIIKKRDNKCVYCRNENNLTLEHIIPLIRGGDSHFNNFVVACKSCNSSKGKKDVFRWCKEEKIKVPKIVITLLNKQKSIKLKGGNKDGTTKIKGNLK